MRAFRAEVTSLVLKGFSKEDQVWADTLAQFEAKVLSGYGVQEVSVQIQTLVTAGVVDAARLRALASNPTLTGEGVSKRHRTVDRGGVTEITSTHRAYSRRGSA